MVYIIGGVLNVFKVLGVLKVLRLREGSDRNLFIKALTYYLKVPFTVSQIVTIEFHGKLGLA